MYAQKHSTRRRSPFWGWLLIVVVGAAMSLTTAGVARSSAAVPANGATSAAIQGQVLGWMDPLGGATVTVFSATTGARLRSTVADGDGTYSIGGLPAGPIKVRATKTGWLPSWANGAKTIQSATVFTLEPGQTLTQSWDPLVLYLDLTPAAVVEGDVMGINDNPDNPWDNPLPGVTVKVFDASTGTRLGSVISDELGQYRLGNLPPTAVELRASKTGWLPARATVTLDPYRTVRVETMVLLAPATIQGEVLSWMDPIGGATVTVFNADTGKRLRSLLADDVGQYRIEGLPPVNIKVRATKPGYLPAWADGGSSFATARVISLYPGQVLSQSWDPMILYLDLTPGAALNGSVRGINQDPANAWDGPIASATVTIFDSATGKKLSAATTDAAGRYSFDGLPGGWVKIRATKSGWLPATSQEFLSAAQTVSTPPLTLAAPAAVRGQVLSQMDPLGGATVTVFNADTGARIGSALADSSGDYRVSGLPAGRVKVRATKTGWFPSWANGRATVATADVFTLSPGVTLSQSWSPIVLYLDLKPRDVPPVS